MKKNLLFSLLIIFTVTASQAQVTQINSNRSLESVFPLNNTKSIYSSATDQTIWVTDGTLAGTIQLSATIKFVDIIGSVTPLNGKLVFVGFTAATGAELYVTDGTPGGTTLVSDINPGTPDSAPNDGGAVLNGFIYFTAVRPAEGRELWRTDGTPGGTSFVKDIVIGPNGSNTIGNYNIISTGTYLLFAASTPTLGVELWKSDGSGGGTAMLKDLNTGNAGADSSNPRDFFMLNNTVLFAAKNAAAGEEIWRTDGTAGGTFQLADINPGTASSTVIPTGFIDFQVFNSFHVFNNKAYFSVFNGTSAGVVWSTDGTIGNTAELKDIISSPSPSLVFVVDAVNLPGKFILPVSDLNGRSELWVSDGTTGGTSLFKAFDPVDPQMFPFIFIPFAYSSGIPYQQLFQGNKFFFLGSTAAEGTELWISDGVDATPAHTHIVENIGPGTADGFDPSKVSYTYTTTAFFFPANNTTNGLELWKSDGTVAGTDIVADIVTLAGSSDPRVDIFLVNNKVLFGADNGDDPNETDLYAVDGNFTPLPISLSDFTVGQRSIDALLQWHTAQEFNSRDFIVQRSFDGVHFDDLGKVNAAGNSSSHRTYAFVDAGIAASGKSIVYYRLLSTDVDGKSTVSPVITLRLKNNGQWTIRLVGNPATGNLKVLLSGVKETIQLSVVDMSGNKLYTSSLSAVNGQISLPTANLPKGIYMVVAESNQEVRSIRFLQ